MPLAAAERASRRMSGGEFRAFQDGRPDHERWELIEGVPVMMTPPLMEHNRIASNLETLLNDALRRHDPARIAIQRPGIEFAWPASRLREIAKVGEYRPEPDVAVVGYDDAIAGIRFTDTAFLLAEVVSSTDEDPTPVGGERWIDAKVRLYQEHRPCEVILLVEQRRMHVTVYERGPNGWTERRLEEADDPLSLPTMGLSCTLVSLYADTRWQPRRMRGDPP